MPSSPRRQSHKNNRWAFSLGGTLGLTNHSFDTLVIRETYNARKLLVRFIALPVCTSNLSCVKLVKVRVLMICYDSIPTLILSGSLSNQLIRVFPDTIETFARRRRYVNDNLAHHLLSFLDRARVGMVCTGRVY